MRTFSRILKFTSCVFGGAVTASFILVVGTQCFYGFGHIDDIESHANFLNVANPIVGLIGALLGGIIYVRGDKAQS